MTSRYHVGQRCRIRAANALVPGVVRYTGHTGSGRVVVGVETDVPVSVPPRQTGDGGQIHRDRRTSRLFGPTAPGRGVLVAESSVLPEDHTAARQHVASSKVQAVYRGSRARTVARHNAAQRYQSSMHMLERAHEQEALAAARRMWEYSESKAADRHHGAHLRAPPSGMGTRACTDTIAVEEAYDGPHLTFPLTADQVTALYDAIVARKHVHYKYVMQLLIRYIETLDQTGRGNCVDVPVDPGVRVVLLGDTHGQLQDVLHVFNTNGRPSDKVHYVFNGDIADRGDRAVEIYVLLAAYRLLYPGSVHINRGNHEDNSMNFNSGFRTEVFTKYGPGHAELVYNRFQTLFMALPLCCVVGGKIFMTHGGLSKAKRVTRKTIEMIHRMKPIPAAGRLSRQDLVFEGLMWADPTDKLRGVAFNAQRQCSVIFGADVTNEFLRLNGWELIIRSHECVMEGYQVLHGGKLMTLFSASHYCGLDKNTGCAVVVEHGFDVRHIVSRRSRLRVTYKVTNSVDHAKLLLPSSEGYARIVEQCLAVEAILTHKAELWQRFMELDEDGEGRVVLDDSLEATLSEVMAHTHVQWGTMLRRMNDTMRARTHGAVTMLRQQGTSTYLLYEVMLNALKVSSPPGFKQGLRQVIGQRLVKLFRATSPDGGRFTNRAAHAVFDLDGDGKVTLAEFVHACTKLGITDSFPEGQVFDLARCIDADGSGTLSLEEIHSCFHFSAPTHMVRTTSEDKDWAMEQLARVSRIIHMKYSSAAEVFHNHQGKPHGHDSHSATSLTKDEFVTFLGRVGAGLSPEDGARLFEALDRDSSGAIDRSEFCRGFKMAFDTPPRRHHGETHVHGRGSGRPGATPPRAPSPRHARRAGAGGDAGAGATASPVHRRSPSVPAHARGGRGSDTFVDRLVDLVCSDMHRFRTTAEHMFKQMAGGAGAGATGGSASSMPRITRQQFRTGLQQLGLGHASALRCLSDADADLLFDAVDTDGDGYLDVDEFVNAFSLSTTGFGDRRELFKSKR